MRLARELGLADPRNPWSEGDGLDLRPGARRGDGRRRCEEFYGRAMPAGIAIEEAEFVPLSQLYGRSPRSCPRTGSSASKGEVSWSETNLVQTIAHWPGGRAWYRVHESRLGERVRERTVADMIEQARAAGAVVREEPPYTSVLVQASVTQTLGGLRIDERARVVGAEGLYAAGADAGGSATGGYSSGLAAGARLRADRRRGSGQLVAGSRYAQGRRSCGSGDCEIRFTTQRPSPSSSTVEPTAGGSPSRSISS